MICVHSDSLHVHNSFRRLAIKHVLHCTLTSTVHMVAGAYLLVLKKTSSSGCTSTPLYVPGLWGSPVRFKLRHNVITRLSSRKSMPCADSNPAPQSENILLFAGNTTRKNVKNEMIYKRILEDISLSLSLSLSLSSLSL